MRRLERKHRSHLRRVRWFALILAVVGIMLVTFQLTEWALDDMEWQSDLTDATLIGTTFLMPAFLLALLGRPLARWLTHPPDGEIPHA